MTGLLLAAALAGCASAASTDTVKIIPNFREVAPGVFRGGQPTPEGWAYLKSKGVKTVIKLNFKEEGDDAEAVRLGMELIDCSGPPSELKNMFSSPKPEALRRAVAVLADLKARPVYVHCLHGQDRTGLVIGLHRVLNEGMSKQAAWVEMRRNGFHRSLRGLRSFWKSFDGKNLVAEKKK